MMRDELFIEDMSMRQTREKMDEAFRAAMQRAIDAGEENTPTAVSKGRALKIRRSCSLSLLGPATENNGRGSSRDLPGRRQGSDTAYRQPGRLQGLALPFPQTEAFCVHPGRYPRPAARKVPAAAEASWSRTIRTVSCPHASFPKR